MLLVLSVVGTRPEAIKMAPVIQELRARPDSVRSVVCSTGQHREMLDQVLRLFQIQPDHELEVMEPNQTLSGLTAALIRGLDSVLCRVRPDWVLAQGDTTTVLAAALAAYYHGARFGHVEAGLRTGDKRRPFPEEVNRLIADDIADLYFCPTERARCALLREGKPEAAIRVTGNTVIDALLQAASMPYDWDGGPLRGLPRDRRYVLVTAHRRESFGEPFRELCQAIRDLAERHGPRGVHFVYPVHLNPNVRGPVLDLLAGLEFVTLLEPLDYLSLVHLMRRSVLILTDSGGIQEEAPGLGVPVLVMRDTTERPEGVAAGVVRLVGTGRERIVAEASRFLEDEGARRRMASGANPYGDGRAARRVVDALVEASHC